MCLISTLVYYILFRAFIKKTYLYIVNNGAHVFLYRLDDATKRDQLKDASGAARVNCMAVYSGERSGHHRPSGPFASLGEASRSLLVGQGVGCSSAQHSPAASRVLPVGDRAGRSSTVKSLNSLLMSENKPLSVIAVLIGFYRHSKSPHSFSFIFHSIYVGQLLLLFFLPSVVIIRGLKT